LFEIGKGGRGKRDGREGKAQQKSKELTGGMFQSVVAVFIEPKPVVGSRSCPLVDKGCFWGGMFWMWEEMSLGQYPGCPVTSDRGGGI